MHLHALRYSRSFLASARRMQRDQVRIADLPFYFRHEPLGIVAAFLPWNAPLLLAMNQAAAVF